MVIYKQKETTETDRRFTMREHGSGHKCYSCGRNVACGCFGDVDDDGVEVVY